MHHGTQHPQLPPSEPQRQKTPEKRKPLYTRPKRGDGVTLERVMNRRRPEPPGALVDDGMRHRVAAEASQRAKLFWQLDGYEEGPFSSTVTMTPRLTSTRTTFLDEIDAEHSSLMRRGAGKPPTDGLTLPTLNRLGGERSKIDYGALRAELTPRSRRGQRSPRVWGMGELSSQAY